MAANIWYGVVCIWLAAVGCSCRDLSSVTTSDPPSYQETVPFDAGLVSDFDVERFDIRRDDPIITRVVVGNEPEQINLKYWGPDRVLVSWVTGEPQDGFFSWNTTLLDLDHSDPPVLKWRDTLYGKWETATGLKTNYKHEYSKANSSWSDYLSATINHVLLMELQAGHSYEYRVGYWKENGDNGKHRAWTDSFSFAIPKGFPLTLALIGDIGQTYNTSLMINHLVDQKFDLILNVGDFTYADNYGPASQNCSGAGRLPWTIIANVSTPFPGVRYSVPLQSTCQHRWDTWGRLTQKLLAYTPSILTYGNHEVETQDDLTTFASASARYPLPSPPGSPLINVSPNNAIDPSLTNNQYYYVDIPGVARVVVISSWIPFDTFKEGTEQRVWLEGVLKQTDRSKTPWLVFSYHAPFYTSYDSHFKENECMRQEYEPLLFSYGVDLVFNGHVHAYERSKPVFNNKPRDCGTVHIVVGDGGNSEGLYQIFIQNSSAPYCDHTLMTKDKSDAELAEIRLFPSYQKNWPHGCYSFDDVTGSYCYTEQPAWSAYREPSFGYGLLDLINGTTAKWTWHRNQDGELQEADSVYFFREDNCENKNRKAEVVS